MRNTSTEFDDSQKAMMLDNIIDEVIKQYETLPALPKGFRSRTELIGYSVVNALTNNGFVTSQGIEGEQARKS